MKLVELSSVYKVAFIPNKLVKRESTSLQEPNSNCKKGVWVRVVF